MNRRISRKLAALQTEPGPKSEFAKGSTSKPAVRHNAYTHGLTAQALLLSDEEQPVYDAMAEDFRRRFQPADGFEQQLLQKIVDTNWRLNICASVESALYAMVPYNAFANPNATPAETYLKDRARVFVDKANAFGLLGRYEAGLDRRFRNMLRELESAIAKRKADQQAQLAQPTLGSANSKLKELVMSAAASSQPQQNASLTSNHGLFRQNTKAAQTTSNSDPAPSGVQAQQSISSR